MTPEAIGEQRKEEIQCQEGDRNLITDSTAFTNSLFTSGCKLDVFTLKTTCDFSPICFRLFIWAGKMVGNTVFYPFLKLQVEA